MLHISDTIQKDEKIHHNDFTHDRISVWYESIANHLWINIAEIDYRASPFGQSHITWYQALDDLICSKYKDTKVILINNASRAKYENSGDAQWSGCLWAELEIEGVTHHVVWVDNEAFSVLQPHLKQGTSIQEIQELKSDNEFWFKHISDLSKGTQFRSKEYFPLVQLIFEKLRQDDGEIDRDRLQQIFTLNPISHISSYYRDIVRWEVVSILQDLWKKYEKKYTLEALYGIEQCQIPGERFRLDEVLGIPMISDYAQVLLEHEDMSIIYNSIRQQLDKNELCVIDRDIFWNLKCVFSSKINGDTVQDFYGENGIWNEQQLGLHHERKKVCELYAVQSISDKTWENCLWGGSSRWIDGVQLLEINKSVWLDGTILEETQNIPIWARLIIDTANKPTKSNIIQLNERR